MQTLAPEVANMTERAGSICQQVHCHVSEPEYMH